MSARVRRLVHLLRRRIAVKLTLTLTGFTGVSALAAGLYVDRAFEGVALAAAGQRLAAVARVLEDGARPLALDGPRAPAGEFADRVARAAAARVSLIGRDGRLLADSSRDAAGSAASEGGRPEVRAALAGAPGTDVRREPPGGPRVLFVAQPVRAGAQVVGALRLAVPVSEVAPASAEVRRVMVAGGLLALGVALGIGLFVSGRVTRPVVEMQHIAGRMSEGRFDVRAPTRSPDEIGTLGRSLNAMADRLRAQIEGLAREQAKAGAILDGMVEGVIAVDGHDRIVLTNSRARAMLGLTAAGLRQQPFLEVVRHAELHRVFGEARTAGPGGGVRRAIRLAAPAPLLLEVHAAPLALGAEGTGVVMVLHDVTELRRLERVRTEFIANVSHELRTPLTAIHGAIETLLEGALADPGDARRFLQVVHRHTERLGRLLDDLTDLSNIELGRVAFKPVAVELADAVDSVVAIVAARRGGVAVVNEVPPDLPPVRADRDRLAQILLNLVDNAVKYTPAGGRVVVAAAPRGREVEVTVRDSGVGIPAGDLPRITERFYRVDKARSRALGGTGLGLAIVKHLVAAHGGDLRIESRLGEGTTVSFTLPRGGPDPAA
jgi:two-component system phosphate regulon sensor histidine kinase PhoR